jgi:hypothetical protein
VVTIVSVVFELVKPLIKYLGSGKGSSGFKLLAVNSRLSFWDGVVTIRFSA